MGVRIHEVFVRNYPFKEYGAHLFGYLGQISEKELEEKKAQHYRPDDVVGMIGLEKTYEPELKGIDGVIIYEMDAYNRTLRQLEEIAPIAGNSLKLTVDWDLQLTAEQALRERLQYLRSEKGQARAGTVIALDPKTGAILTMVSYPSFDPNMFVGKTPPDWYQKMARNPLHPFMNRAISSYPPGSVFKAVTALAALEEKVVGTSEKFFCTGYDPIFKDKKKCWTVSQGKPPHGRVDLVAGIKNSCNIVFYELGRRLTIERLAEYAREMGFGQKTGLKFYPQEKEGIVPDPAYRGKYYRKNPEMARWYPSETLSVAIGQGELLVTPLQIAQLYMAIANCGKVYRPHLIQEMKDCNGQTIKVYRPEVMYRLNYRHESWQIVQEGLKAVAGPGGTAGGAFYGTSYEVAGKTGTAQNSMGDDHGWFAGYAPFNNPQIVVVVMIECGGAGSTAAAPIARKVIDKYLGVETRYALPSKSRPSPSPGAEQPQATPPPPEVATGEEETVVGEETSRQ